MKKILLFTAVGVFSTVVGLGIYINQSTLKTSELIAQNIEALARSHSGGDGDEPGKSKCYSQYHKSDNDSCLRCSTCDWADGVGVETGGWCP